MSEVVLPGGLLLPPPEIHFGVVGVWDIPDDQAWVPTNRWFFLREL